MKTLAILSLFAFFLMFPFKEALSASGDLAGTAASLGVKVRIVSVADYESGLLQNEKILQNKRNSERERNIKRYGESHMALFERMDQNGDNIVTRKEFREKIKIRYAMKLFNTLDKDRNYALSLREMANFGEAKRQAFIAKYASFRR